MTSIPVDCMKLGWANTCSGLIGIVSSLVLLPAIIDRVINDYPNENKL
ncbi:MAG TPA: hypothetical protein VE130_08030 [Nitrososphaeraceae archaeon]|nr:hypothetical protein [Nitrososphaeraceae archaeon]